MCVKFTKIISTIGPSSRNKEVIRKLIEEGTNVFRLNFSHGTKDDHKLSVQLIREANKELGIDTAIFIDLQGPKIRIGDLEKDKAELKADDTFIITTEKITGNEKIASIDYTNLHNEIAAGARILIDDGNIELAVENVSGNKISTKIIAGGFLKPHKGVNLPFVKLEKLSSVTEKDIRDLDFAFENEVDYVALSFVRHAADVKNLIEIMKKKYGRPIPVIAKIETPQAVEDIDNILEEAQAIMVARGDLGVETSAAELPVIQKKIIRKCNIAGIPVITATQMMESMINNAKPTRAEANDVANSILDGTDAIMLSGETAAGKYPVEAVSTMKDIAIKTEESQIYKDTIFNLKNLECFSTKTKLDTGEAVSYAAVELADKIHAKFIVAFTITGSSALLAAKYKPKTRIIAFSPIHFMVNRLALVWGIIPLSIADFSSIDKLIEEAVEILKKNKYVKKSDTIVVTAGAPLGWTGKTNMLKVVNI
jgi:pyruvate kinase